MGLFGTKKIDDRPITGMATGTAAVTESGHVPASHVRSQGPPPHHGNGRVGIDHAIQLIRSLPTDKNVELVVTVLKATLESLGIRVADIIQDASQRQQDIETRVAQFKSEIATLEAEIDQRAQEIQRLEAAHSETTKVRDYLERDAIDLPHEDTANG